MIKLLTRVFAVSIALGSSPAIADEEITKPATESVVRMAILGTFNGIGVFSANALSISVGRGEHVIGGYVANAASGAIGTAVIAGGNLVAVAGSLLGFESFSSPYETCLVAVGTCH